jgi:hypothetical protein
MYKQGKLLHKNLHVSAVLYDDDVREHAHDDGLRHDFDSRCEHLFHSNFF